MVHYSRAYPSIPQTSWGYTVITKTQILNFAGVLGLAIVVANNIMQFMEYLMSPNNTTFATIGVLIFIGILLNVEIIKRLR